MALERSTDCPYRRFVNRSRAPGRVDTLTGNTRNVALTGMMAAVLAVCSWVAVPFYPVPLTLQTLAVLVAGGLLGPLWGSAGVVVYLLLGLAGLPVYAGFASGPGVLFGPRGGYLVGFVLAAAIMGFAGDAAAARGMGGRRAVVSLAVGAALAGAAIYVVGLPWLMIVTGMGLREAVIAGMAPFVPGDILKAAVAVLLVRAVGSSLRAQGLR